MTSEQKKPRIPPALSRMLQFGAGILIAGVGLWIFFKDCDLHKLLAQVCAYHPAVLVIGGSMAVVTIWLRAVRWKIILPKTPGTNRSGLFGTTMIGFMINNILPARLGEVARVLLLWRKNRYPAATAIGSLVLERGIDTLVFMSFFFVPVFLLPGLAHLRAYAVPLAMIFTTCIVFFAAYAVLPAQTRRLLLALTGVIPAAPRARFQHLLDDVMTNLNWVLSIRAVILVVLLSFAIELCYAVMMIILVQDARSFGVLQGMFSTAYAALGAAIPLAPGYVGTLHALLLQGLTALGMESDRARALAIVYHALGYLITTALGLVIYFRTDITLTDISRSRDDLKGSTNAPDTKDVP